MLCLKISRNIMENIVLIRQKISGIDYVIDSLHKERCRTAVISNKADYAVKILCDDFFPGKFDAVYGERESMGIKKA